uniref:DUF19 domain-containing protein n=1 Tax=Caenorhabditis tropicalis TaxID=1561998 RepID=A0A1I7V2A2_9PELO
MIVFSSFIIFFGTILIGFVQGASVPPIGSGDNCTVADTYHAMSCAFRMIDFGAKIEELDVEDRAEMKEFKRSCVALDNCFESVGHCRAFNDEQGRRAFRMVKTYCGILTFIAESFKECDDKLAAHNSTCYNDWDPFVEEIVLDDKTEEACNNYFGKDQCLKKEVVEQCSQKEWDGLRETLITLNKEVLKQCDFKNLA